MDIISRLKQFIDTHEIPVTQFADNCRIPRPTLSQLLNGRNKKVSDEVISKIHQAYPNLSVLWLMFGEGNMEGHANIATSERQNDIETIGKASNRTETLDIDPRIDFESGYHRIDTEKNITETENDSESFSDFQNSPHDSNRSQDETSATITFDNKGKRVISIVVYYDDNSYESFVPDPSGRSPFVR